MILTLEGPDGAGKTTLADAVETAFREVFPGREVVRLHAGPPDPPDRNAVEEYETGILRAMPADPEALLICDRWDIGEAVYGPILRGKSRLSGGQLLHVQLFLEGLGAKRVVLLPPWKTVLSRFKKRGDTLIDEDELWGIYEEYARLAPVLGCTVVRHAPPPPSFIEATLRNMRISAFRGEALSRCVPGYAGPLWPLKVLAGDVRSPNHQLPEHQELGWVSAFTPLTEGCALWLMNQLWDYAPRIMAEVGLLNTGEPGMDLAYADEVLGKPEWVALGHAAAGRLGKAGVPFTMAYHPQYVKRFRRNLPQTATYALELLDG